MVMHENLEWNTSRVLHLAALQNYVVDEETHLTWDKRGFLGHLFSFFAKMSTKPDCEIIGHFVRYMSLFFKIIGQKWCPKKLLPSPPEFKSHFLACFLLVSWMLISYTLSIHELLTWPCALNNLGFTLSTILGMRGTAQEVPSQICHLEKKNKKHLGDKLPNITKNA